MVSTLIFSTMVVLAVMYGVLWLVARLFPGDRASRAYRRAREREHQAWLQQEQKRLQTEARAKETRTTYKPLEIGPATNVLHAPEPPLARDDSAVQAVRTSLAASRAGISIGFGDRPPVAEMSISDFYAMANARMSDGDWDTARYWLQKIAYGMVKPSVSATEKAQFTAFMTEFARRDPLYHQLMERTRSVLEARPGALQSEFTKGRLDHQSQAVRYVFYFAEQLGELVRISKGNTYRLYLPGQDTSIEQPRPKRRKKKA